jgi:hypothetical protein
LQVHQHQINQLERQEQILVVDTLLAVEVVEYILTVVPTDLVEKVVVVEVDLFTIQLPEHNLLVVVEEETLVNLVDLASL